MALEVTQTLQTCKTCFRGPRMVLHAHFKKHIIALGGWLLMYTSGPPSPPVWQKTRLFPDFFFATFPKRPLKQSIKYFCWEKNRKKTDISLFRPTYIHTKLTFVSFFLFFLSTFPNSKILLWKCAKNHFFSDAVLYQYLIFHHFFLKKL